MQINPTFDLIFASMYKHDNVLPNAESNLSKKEQVAAMFDKIAGKYDFFNRFLSAGTDKGWRKKALAYLKPLEPKVMLDVATGTADVALMANKILKPNSIVGIDISKEMLNIGQQKIEKANCQDVIKLQIGDSEAINFDAETFDAITVAFGVRNFQNLEKGIAELHRVLKTGSRLIVLEFSKPKNNTWHNLYNLYMGIVAPTMVSVFSKNKKAYQYLNSSVNAFPERDHFIEVLNKAGFKKSFYKELSFGICCIYVADK
jgi:demethylmenaquinone methyltransferase / 2-methoxy-6-polyprenyl-1,4-benzoquinol methylase